MHSVPRRHALLCTPCLTCFSHHHVRPITPHAALSLQSIPPYPLACLLRLPCPLLISSALPAPHACFACVQCHRPVLCAAQDNTLALSVLTSPSSELTSIHRRLTYRRKPVKHERSLLPSKSSSSPYPGVAHCHKPFVRLCSTAPSSLDTN